MIGCQCDGAYVGIDQAWPRHVTWAKVTTAGLLFSAEPVFIANREKGILEIRI